VPSMRAATTTLPITATPPRTWISVGWRHAIRAGREVERDDAAGAAIAEIGRRHEHATARDHRRGLEHVPADRGGPHRHERRRELRGAMTGVTRIAAELRPVSARRWRRRWLAHLERLRRSRVAARTRGHLDDERVRAGGELGQRAGPRPAARRCERDRRGAVDARGDLAIAGVELGRHDDRIARSRARALRRRRDRHDRCVDRRAVIRAQPRAVDRDDAIAGRCEIEATLSIGSVLSSIRPS